jgi:hypothetical protein
MRIFLVLVMLFSTTSVFAAGRCVLSPFDEAAETAIAIFTGVVKEIHPRDAKAKKGCGEQLVTLKTLYTYKGEEQPTHIIFTEDSCDGLGVRFALGQPYLVFAMSPEATYQESWTEAASLCFRTAHTSTAQAKGDMKALMRLFR